MDDPDTPMTRKPADEEPFSALAFKIMADKYVGTLTFCRVYRCVEKAADPVASALLRTSKPFPTWALCCGHCLFMRR